MTRTRDDLLAKLRTMTHTPVLIVGGGINGMGTFRDLALQGVPSLLVERGDFCSGASRAPSRMIHGGIKYLENGEFRLVKESAHERNRLLSNAAHYVHPLEMVLPIHSWTAGIIPAIKRFFKMPAKVTQRGAAVIKAGLTVYDIYGKNDRVMPRHRMISRGDALHEIPDLDPKIVAAASYYDAWITSPERLTVELALDGMDACDGSVALNHLSFDGVEDGKAVLRDALSGEVFRIGCDIMVNAAGAWIDGVNDAAGGAKKMIGGNKGSHLLLDLPVLAERLHGRMVYFEVAEGRLCLISNFMGHVLLGSTDIPVTDPDSVVCDDEETDYLLGALRTVFPEVKATRDDIFFSYAGVRPLPASDATDPGKVSRDHSMPEVAPTADRPFPVIALVGGKWTTFRAFAAEATDAVLGKLGKSRRIHTDYLPIGGGRGLSRKAAPTEELISEVAAMGTTHARAARLVACYGSRAKDIAATFDGPETFLATLPQVSREELAFIVNHEVAATAEDVLFGRSALFLEGPQPRGALTELVQTLATICGWDEARIAEEEAALVERYRRHHRIVFADNGQPEFA